MHRPEELSPRRIVCELIFVNVDQEHEKLLPVLVVMSERAYWKTGLVVGINHAAVARC